MTTADLSALSIADLQPLLRRREISSGEVIDALASRIEAIDGEIGAYLSLDLEHARREAEAVDVSLPLGGVPIAIKDIINVAGQPCTCASKMLRDFRAPYDATIVQKLRAAGAIPFGRTNMDEFAMGSSGENSCVRATRNPWDLSRVSGGSSSGSAAAVAADCAFGALGTDTGGSIRQPAAMCGVVGVKPSYGRVSRYGVVAFASSLDQTGPLAKTVRDAAMLLNAIAGGDANDSTCLNEPVPDYTALLGHEIKGMRVGVVKEYLHAALDPQVRDAVNAAAAQLDSLGAEIAEVSLPHTEFAIAAYYIIATAEASTNLARFDGVRYGHRAENVHDLFDHYCRTRADGFGGEVKRRIILGTHVLSSGYYDAYYLRAQKVRELIRRDFTEAFRKADILMSPTSPTPAFGLGERLNDPLQLYLADICTIAANLAGICGISIPCGFVRTENGAQLPIGLQLLGRPFDEGRLLQMAHAFEQSTEWHKRRSPLATEERRPAGRNRVVAARS